MTSRFEIKKSENNYYFIICSPKNEVLATSNGYNSKTDCWHGAQKTKKYAQIAPIIDQTK
jgi:uncharacterized protein YegP (UPF0339 family)